mmetsp:Transcript_23909/g.35897  ORF Transcript_23909/g.35897 Transcript_23909/m.35897 type:complete len:82 (-) Transcript_23909:96-341(-)
MDLVQNLLAILWGKDQTVACDHRLSQRLQEVEDNPSSGDDQNKVEFRGFLIWNSAVIVQRMVLNGAGRPEQLVTAAFFFAS